MSGWGRVGVWALVGLLAAWQPAQARSVVRYYVTDALGSAVVVTDESGDVVERREYEPYGAQLVPALQDGPGYTGHVQDAATGLVYMQQRYYDPMLGVFLSVDPITAYADPVVHFNVYRYANDNPYRFFDLDGRSGCTGTRITQICDTGGVPGLQSSAGPGGGSLAINPRTSRARAAQAERYIDAVGPAVERELRDTPEESAELFGNAFRGMGNRLGLEFGGRIVPSEISLEKWQITEIVISREFNRTTGIGFNIIIKSVQGGYDVHTHPLMSSMSHWFHPFSSADEEIVSRFKVNSFLIQPDGGIYLLSPGKHPERVK